MKQPQKLPLSRMYNALPDNIKQNKEMLSFHNGMGVVIHIDNSIFRQVELASSPFILEDYRIGMIVRGKMRGVINLREYEMTAGTVVIVTPGTIVEPRDVSDDFLMEGMGLPADKFLLAHGGNLPELFSGQTRDARKIVTGEDQGMVDKMFHLLHDLMEGTNASKDVIYNMVATITHYISQLFSEQNNTSIPSHSKELFNRFLRLVNLYGYREHQLSFYAEKLCITSRYLGSLVQSTSGVGAKEWIDRAIIAKAKVMLRHSDMQTTQIADELNFPNASFFCKYFKRITGVTPLQYRKEEYK